MNTNRTPAEQAEYEKNHPNNKDNSNLTAEQKEAQRVAAEKNNRA